MLQGLQRISTKATTPVRKTSGVRDRSDEGRLRVTGPDRAAWLQGLLTNDIAAVKPGGGCYAAYLTPQGRMISDVRVLERGDFMLLDVPAAQKAFVLERLTTFIIMEDVAVDDVTESLARVAVHGPGAAALLERVVKVDDGTPLASLAEHASTVAQFDGHPVVIAGSRELGADVAGFDRVLPRAGERGSAARARSRAGAEPIADNAWHALRVEAGRPLFGVDMTTETIPLEAGIEDRAISFTKGCYVGQEIIIRVMHRGGGRVARKLVGLRPRRAVVRRRPTRSPRTRRFSPAKSRSAASRAPPGRRASVNGSRWATFSANPPSPARTSPSASPAAASRPS